MINDEQSKEKGYEAEGEIYVPASVASTYMDQRIYVDTVESGLSYVTSGGVILARAGEVSYQVGKETQNAKKPILQKKDDAFYVSLSFIKEHKLLLQNLSKSKTPCDYVRPKCVLYDGITDRRYPCAQGTE